MRFAGGFFKIALRRRERSTLKIASFLKVLRSRPFSLKLREQIFTGAKPFFFFLARPPFAYGCVPQGGPFVYGSLS
jgi:hypothetical protein